MEQPRVKVMMKSWMEENAREENEGMENLTLN